MKTIEREQSFVFGVSVSDYNFIGRKSEIRQLKMNFLRCIISGHHDDFGEMTVREDLIGGLSLLFTATHFSSLLPTEPRP